MADGTITRTMRVLSTLCLGGPQTLTALSDAVGLTPSTTLRFLRILQEEGYVTQRDDNRQWQATLEVWRLGAAVISQGGWIKLLNEVVQEVARDTGETSIFAAYQDGWAMYLAHGASRHTVRTHVDIGGRYHASELTSGRAMLAHLPEDELDRVMIEHWSAKRWSGEEGEALRAKLARIAERGYSSDTSTRWPGVWGCSVPVLDAEGAVVGALGISVPPTRHPEDDAAEEAIAELLKSMAARLSGLQHIH